MATATELDPDSDASLDHGRWLKQQAPGWLRPASALLAGLEALLLIGQAGLIAVILHGALIDQVSRGELFAPMLSLLVVVGGRALIQGARGLQAERASVVIRQGLRDRLFRHLCLSDPRNGAQFQTGALAHQVVDRVDRLDPFYSRFLPQQYSALLIPLTIVIAVAWINWLAGLLLAIAAPIIPLFMALIGMGAERLSRDQAVVTARLSGLFHDRLRGLSTIQRFGAGDRVIAWLSEAADDYRERTMRVLRLAFLSSAVLEFFAAVAIASLAIYIGLSLIGYMEIGPSDRLELFSGLFILLLAPDFFLALRQLAQHWHDRADALAAAEDLRKLLARPTIPQPAHAPQTSIVVDKKAVQVEIDELDFAYSDRVLFQRLNCRIEAGERLLITGPSGCGKSTLLMLIGGLIRPTRGVVRYDASRISDWNDRTLARHRAWLNQDSVIFDRSLRDNLTLGRRGIDDRRLIDALELCGLGDLLDYLDRGLDTHLGDSGARLSGGQARRIALARTLLEPRPLLLLDEPSEHLDAASENALWDAVDRVTSERSVTVIAVSHRPRARRWARRVLELPEAPVSLPTQKEVGE